MLVDVFLPTLVTALVRISATASICRAPFRNKYGKACVNCLFAVGAFAGSAPVVGAAPAVAIGVVVQGVSGILLGVVDFVSDCCLRVLIPLGGSHENQVVGIFADDWNDLVGVGFNVAPRNIFGFVEQFENDVVVFAVGLSHFFEEILGSIRLLCGFMRMPVDNHVNVVLDGGFDDRFHELLLVGWVDCITFELDSVVFTGPVFVSGCHGCAHNLDVHVANHGGNAFFAPEFNSLRHQAPVKAHATHLHFGAVLDAFAAAVNAALSLRVFACH